jgi:hypothetical protein
MHAHAVLQHVTLTPTLKVHEGRNCGLLSGYGHCLKSAVTVALRAVCVLLLQGCWLPGLLVLPMAGEQVARAAAAGGG